MGAEYFPWAIMWGMILSGGNHGPQNTNDFPTYTCVDEQILVRPPKSDQLLVSKQYQDKSCKSINSRAFKVIHKNGDIFVKIPNLEDFQNGLNIYEKIENTKGEKRD